jgi:CDP-glucose 4,6-dehydratase
MRILVTGATGAMGAALAKRLLMEGNEVTSISHDDRPSDASLAFGVREKINWAHGDIVNENFVKRVIADYEIEMVYHLAALPIVRMGTRNTRPLFEVNTLGTLSVLEALKEQTASGYDISMILCSTDKVYGETEWGRPYRETDPLNALAPYETTKAIADITTQMFQKMDYVKKVGIVRPSNTYGPGDVNSRIIPNTIKRCMAGENPLLYKGIPYIREYTYIDDFVDGITTVGNFVHTTNKGCYIYNLGSGFNADQETVLKEILRHFPVAGLKIEEITPPDYTRIEIPYQTLDSSKAFRELGWKTKTTFERGMARTVDWWKMRK